MTIGDPFGPPLFPEPITLPSGVPGFYNPYTGGYVKSRTYAERLQRGYQRGMSQSEARGHRAVGGMSESQLRRAGISSPVTRYIMAQEFQRTYGFSLDYWNYLVDNWIDEINSMSAPTQQITPAWITQEFANTDLTGHDEVWVEARLDEKLRDMLAYRMGDTTPGALHFNQRDNLAPIEWWFYH